MDFIKSNAPVVSAEVIAYSDTVVSYLLKESPQVFNKVTSFSANNIEAITQASPQLFSAAQNAGNTVASFVSAQNSQIISGVISTNQSVINYLSEKSTSLSYSNQVVHPSASGISNSSIDGVHSSASQLSGKVDFSNISSLLSHLKSEVNFNFVTTISNIDASVSSDILAVASEIPGAVIAAGAAIQDTLQDVFTPEVIQELVLMTGHIVGTAAAAMPFLLPLQMILKDIGTSIQQASFNVEASTLLAKRCCDCTKLVAEMAPKILLLSKNLDEQIRIITPFEDALKECNDFIKKFTSKGFLSHMFQWKKDQRKLSALDKKVTDSLQNLSMRVDGKQIDIQLATAQKLDELFDLFSNNVNSTTEVEKQLSPDALIEILTKAGCKGQEEITFELSSVGFKLDEIAKITQKISTKLDYLSGKIEVINDSITTLVTSLNDRDDEFKELIMKNFLESQKQVETIALTVMKGMRDNGRNITEVVSTVTQIDRMAERCNEAMKKYTCIAFHFAGIGEDTRELKDGQEGERGESDLIVRHGKHGMRGSSYGSAGGNGEDGQNGSDGGDGGDGGDGLETSEFEISIEYVSSDIQSQTIKYRIEFAGLNGKEEHFVDINPSKTVFYIDGRGGNGGKGGRGGDGGNGGNGG